MMTYEYWGMGNCGSLQPLSTYAEAQKRFDDTKPIRGRNPEVRPLGNKRRYAWYEIRKNTNVVEDGFLGQYITTYACVLFNSNCVEFYPDGKVAIRTVGWHTPTTMAFINYTTRNFGHIESVKGKWYWKQKHDGKLFSIKNKELMLKPNAEGKLEVDNPVKEHKYAISRKAMNEVRKKYAFFSDYCSVMLAMNKAITKEANEESAKQTELTSSDLIGQDYRWSAVKSVSVNRTKFFEQLNKVTETGNLDLMYALAIHVCFSFGHWSYRTSTTECSPEAFKKKWNELLKYQFFKEVTVTKDVDVGVGFKDTNTKYL